MEQYKKNFKEAEVNDFARFLEQNAMGNIVILNDTPTSDSMKGNTLGFYNDKLYLKLANGKIYSVGLTEI